MMMALLAKLAAAMVILVASAAEDQASSTEAKERVNSLVQGMRRLQYSYDYDADCVSSLRECVDDSNCDSNEECFFTTSRKKRKLQADSDKKVPNTKLRALLFGSNAVGQCVCL